MKYIKIGLKRAVFPFIIMSIIIIILCVKKDAERIRGAFFSMIIITSLVGFSSIYDMEELDSQKQLLIHFICMTFTLLPSLIFSGWYRTETISDYFIIFEKFIICDVILWITSYFIFIKIITNKKN